MPYKRSLGRSPLKITLRLSPELYRTLREIAMKRNEALAALIRRILREWVASDA